MQSTLPAAPEQSIRHWCGRTEAQKQPTPRPGKSSVNEEIVTRDFLLATHPSGIINIADASHIERNLYLTMQPQEEINERHITGNTRYVAFLCPTKIPAA